MEKCKTKSIQGNSGILTHIPVYSGIFRNDSGIFRIFCNPGIFGALACSEPLHIQNQSNIQNPGILRTLTYSYPHACLESYYIQSPVKHLRQNVLQKQLTGINIFANYNYFRNNFSCSLLFEIFFNLFMHNVVKWPNTLKILRCSHRKIFKL